MTTSNQRTIPLAFIWRRLHSLAGLWLVVYLTIHLLTNSQAALFIGDDGIGFIHAVNSIHELPYLPLIEILILALPILVHVIWGIQYLRTAKYNSFGNTGIDPYLPENKNNRAYTWQRITSYFLIVGILAHVIHMRVIEYPTSAQVGSQHVYSVRISADDGLYTLAERIGAKIYDKQQIGAMQKNLTAESHQENGSKMASQDILIQEQLISQEKNRIAALEKRPLKGNEVIAEANSFGIVELLMLRDTFKQPLMLVLYTLLVLSACFHAFNGLWTLLISWGITLTERSQYILRIITNLLMIIVASFGLASIWLTYWINLIH